MHAIHWYDSPYATVDPNPCHEQGEGSKLFFEAKTAIERAIYRGVVNKKPAIGLLDIGMESKQRLANAGILTIEDLEKSSKNTLRTIKINLETIEKIESILTLRNPNFRGWEK